MTNELNLLDFLIVFARNKIKIIINFIVVCIVAVLLSLTQTKYYRAQTVFMPQGPSGGSVSSLLGAELGGDFLGASKLSKRQYVTLLESRELREELIHKFNLIELYENTKMPNPLDKTLLDLKKNIKVDVEEEGGLGVTNVLSVAILAIDKDPVRAADMANYAFELLEKRVKQLNSQEHDAVITFLTRQIALCDEKLATARERKKQFQIANHAYQVPQQVSMVLQAIATQKAELLALESQRQYMQSTHASGYEGINALNQKINSLNAQIADMEKGDRNDIFPGLTHAVDIADEYLDLVKDVETYVALRFLLLQQQEQATLRKAKDYTGIYLVDTARPPQWKFKPKRSLFVAVIVFLYMAFFMSYLLFREHFRILREQNPDKLTKYDSLFKHLTSFKDH